MPDPEAMGLLALMLLHESRRVTRLDADGDIVLLEDQDRSQWDQALIVEGREFIQQSLRSKRFGVYTLQAAISAVHSEARVALETDWAQIVALYDMLLRVYPSPVVELNRAVAIAMRDDLAAGLALIDGILDRGDLSDYYLAHSARGELLRRLGRNSESRSAFQRALSLTKQAPEQRFLQRRLHSLDNSP